MLTIRFAGKCSCGTMNGRGKRSRRKKILPGCSLFLSLSGSKSDSMIEAHFGRNRRDAREDALIRTYCPAAKEEYEKRREGEKKKNGKTKRDSMPRNLFKRQTTEDVATGICGITQKELKDLEEHEPEPFPKQAMNDMKLSERQKKIIEENSRNAAKSNITTRTVGSGEFIKHWPSKNIPWEFAADFPEKMKTRAGREVDMKEIIKDAMEHISKYTCAKFVEKKKTDKSYIRFQAATYCLSYVGMMDPDKDGDINVVHLSGDANKGIAVHEILHSFGFIHEHSRADRDKYIKILWEFIDSNDGGEYCTGEQDYGSAYIENDYGIPYDFNSVMHYPLNVYVSENSHMRHQVIELKDEWKECAKRKSRCKVGQEKGLSKSDARRINALFKCEMNPLTEDDCTVDPRGRTTSLTDRFP